MYVFHTGNYVRSHYNFRISGLNEEANFSVIASTLFNIHFRGSPSKPSQFLIEQLADRGVQLSDAESIHIDVNESPNWKSTILGGEGDYNPPWRVQLDIQYLTVGTLVPLSGCLNPSPSS